MQLTALAARSILVMQQVTLAWCIIFKYVHATKHHFACCQKWIHAEGMYAYASRGVCHAHNFL
jgi:hypothetical protein